MSERTPYDGKEGQLTLGADDGRVAADMALAGERLCAEYAAAALGNNR